MTWILITLLLLAAIGPAFYFMPSKRDRRLARLRQAAHLAGLTVQMRKVRKMNPEPSERVSSGGQLRETVFECASYALPLARRLRYVSPWRLLRDSTSSTPIEGWTFDPDLNRPAPDPDVAQILGRALAELPADVVAIETGERQVLIYWLEMTPADEACVEGFKRSLQGLISALQTVDEARSEQTDS